MAHELFAKLRILIIEDDRDDVIILQELLVVLNIPNEMTCFRTGEEAVEYLEGRTAIEGTARQVLPDIIFLDLRLPGEDGLAILKKFRRHHGLRAIPVIVMSASSEPEDLMESYRSGGTFFMPKGADRAVLAEIIRQSKILSGMERIEENY